MKRLILLVLLTVTLAACASGQTEPTAASAQTGQQPPASLTPPPAATPLTLTPTSSESGEVEPPDSLTVDALHQRLDPFTSTVEGCMLPCYNGLTLANADLTDVLNFYARLGISTADLIPGDYDAVQDGSGRVGAWLTKTTNAAEAESMGLAAPLVDIYVEDNTAQYMYIGWQYLPPYLTAAHVLNVLGPPEAFELALVPGEASTEYMLRMQYDNGEMGFAFYGVASGDPAAPVLCFTADEAERTFFGLFAPGVPSMAGLAYDERLLPVDTALGVPADQAATEIVAGQCLSITPEQMAQWQGVGE